MAKKRHNLPQFDAAAKLITADAYESHGFGDREDEQYGIDPVTVITLVSNLLPAILSCWTKKDTVDPAQAYARIQKMHARNPKGLRSRIRKGIAIQGDRDGVIMTVDQIEALTTATINHALQVNEAEFNTYAAQAKESSWDA